MADDAAFEKFKTTAVEVLSVKPEQVTMDARFSEDLGADSLDLVEFVMALEETFDVKIEESELDGVTTVRQAYDLATSKQSS